MVDSSDFPVDFITVEDLDDGPSKKMIIETGENSDAAGYTGLKLVA